MAPERVIPAGRNRQARLLKVATIVAAGVAAVRFVGQAFISASRTPVAASRGASATGLRGRTLSPTALRAEEEEGFLKFLKVEQDIELSPEEYKLALEQEMESQRKKYYIGGKVKPGNLIVPWKDVTEEQLAKDAKKALKKNGIIDPDEEEVDDADQDSGLAVQVVGEQDVRLDWTAGEPGTRVGYIVERKKAMESNFREIATYENQGTPYLLMKNYKGHEYTYVDDLVDPGAYTYRILYRMRSGQITVVDQKDVTVPELSGTDNFVALGVFGVFAIITLAYGVVVDQPIK